MIKQVKIIIFDYESKERFFLVVRHEYNKINMRCPTDKSVKAKSSHSNHNTI